MLVEKQPTKFTALQLELLRLYSMELPEKDLLQIKELLGKYFLERLSETATQSASQLNYTQQDYDSWLNDPGQ